MKILYVIPYFPPAYAFGGPPQFAFQLARALAKRKHNIYVYTSDAKDQYSLLGPDVNNVIDGINIRYMKNLSITTMNRLKLFITPELLTRMRAEIGRFDIVHLHEYRSFQNIITHHYAKKNKTPYILQAHGSLPKIMSKERLKSLYDTCFGYATLKDSSKVIALTSFEVQQYMYMGVPSEKITIIPNGIDLTEYSGVEKGKFRQKFGIDEKKKIILYLGRLHKIKGIDFLLNAYSYLIRKLKAENCILVLVGGSDDGYLAEIKYLINKLNLREHVLLTGPLYERDRLEAYMDAEMVVLPSRYETFPTVVLEAYACSKPVIASRVGSIPDLVIDGKTGFLFEKGNVINLANNINVLLQDSSAAEKMGLAGRKLVESRFSIDKITDKFEKLYVDSSFTYKSD